MVAGLKQPSLGEAGRITRLSRDARRLASVPLFSYLRSLQIQLE